MKEGAAALVATPGDDDDEDENGGALAASAAVFVFAIWGGVEDAGGRATVVCSVVAARAMQWRRWRRCSNGGDERGLSDGLDGHRGKEQAARPRASNALGGGPPAAVVPERGASARARACALHRRISPARLGPDDSPPAKATAHTTASASATRRRGAILARRTEE